MFMILRVKTYLCISYLEKLLTNFQLFPLVTEPQHIGKTGERAQTSCPLHNADIQAYVIRNT